MSLEDKAAARNPENINRCQDTNEPRETGKGSAKPSKDRSKKDKENKKLEKGEEK